jgi:uncharacterized protein
VIKLGSVILQIVLEVNHMNGELGQSGGMSVREAGRRGGEATKAHMGPEYFKKIGSVGGKTTAFLYGRILGEFGTRGGRPRRQALD